MALGGNLGDPMARFREALAALPGLARVSSVYQTEPMGGPPGQPDYLNAVCELVWARSPWQLLDLALELEARAGRRRSLANAPRPLDLDLIWIDGLTVDSVRLTLPHPRAGERRFVLEPLAELAPDVAALLARRSPFGRVLRVAEPPSTAR
jgi:2-amino-4-hydroxy-6-hydroxymethyldihydropteridine diphosphokinase